MKTQQPATPNQRGAALVVASLALATDALLYGLVVPVLPLLASDQGASTVGVGLLFAAGAAVPALAAALLLRPRPQVAADTRPALDG